MTVLRTTGKKQYSKYLGTLEKAKYMAKHLHLNAVIASCLVMYS